MFQLGGLEEDRAKYEEQGVQIIALAVQSQEDAAASVTKSEAGFPVLADSDHAVADAYGVYNHFGNSYAAPSVFIISQDGQIVWDDIAENSTYRASSETILSSLAMAGTTGEDLTELTKETLIGVWKRQEGEAFYFQFSEDGTFQVASSEAFLKGSTFDMGEFQLEGALLTLTTNDESSDCAGQVGSYQMELTEEGDLQFTLVDDECALRGPDAQLSPWERVADSPSTAKPTQLPPVGTDITIELPEGDPERGRALAYGELKGLDGYSPSCSNCHMVARPIGGIFEATEELPAIGDRGAFRLAEADYTGTATTPEQYLFESIVLPKAHLIEGRWLYDMDEDLGQRLTRQDVADLIAWMITLK